MDYRKPVTFGENWSPSRYKVLPYFAHEKRIMQMDGVKDILDLGCASGWNMSRFNQYGKPAFGLEVNSKLTPLALHHGPTVNASGLDLPFPNNAFDVIYIQHVLHHIGDVPRALDEVKRCLRPGGALFLIETVEDNPIIRWGRRLYPSWLGDEVNAPFYFKELRGQLGDVGFDVQHAEQYSILFWIWEILPDQMSFMERLTPFFVTVEQLLQKLFKRQSAHCFYVARLPAIN